VKPAETAPAPARKASTAGERPLAAETPAPTTEPPRVGPGAQAGAPRPPVALEPTPPRVGEAPGGVIGPGAKGPLEVPTAAEPSASPAPGAAQPAGGGPSAAPGAEPAAAAKPGAAPAAKPPELAESNAPGSPGAKPPEPAAGPPSKPAAAPTPEGAGAPKPAGPAPHAEPAAEPTGAAGGKQEPPGAAAKPGEPEPKPAEPDALAADKQRAAQLKKEVAELEAKQAEARKRMEKLSAEADRADKAAGKASREAKAVSDRGGPRSAAEAAEAAKAEQRAASARATRERAIADRKAALQEERDIGTALAKKRQAAHLAELNANPETHSPADFNKAANSPASNTTYRSGTYFWETDGLGRTIEAGGRVVAEPYGRDPALQAQIGKTGKAGDVGFHVIGDAVKGPTNRLNVVPGSGSLNRSGYAAFENAYRGAASNPSNVVEVEIELKYGAGNTTARPDQIIGRYRVNGGDWVAHLPFDNN
jgi:hypothetical protein